MSNEQETYRVWVGCLACYNGGALVGDWFDAEDAPTSEEDFNERVSVPRSHTHDVNPHEELWVFDHENSPVSGEYSPNAAVEYAEWIAELDPEDREAFTAWLRTVSETLEDDSVWRFNRKKIGYYDGGHYDHYGPQFVAKGWAEERLTEEQDQAIVFVNDWSRTDYDKGARDFVVRCLETWGAKASAEEYAFTAEANGEIDAIEMNDGRAFVYDPNA